eukprot:6177955-Pleurochrysis_carterae.AAC.9
MDHRSRHTVLIEGNAQTHQLVALKLAACHHRVGFVQHDAFLLSVRPRLPTRVACAPVAKLQTGIVRGQGNGPHGESGGRYWHACLKVQLCLRARQCAPDDMVGHHLLHDNSPEPIGCSA